MPNTNDGDKLSVIRSQDAEQFWEQFLFNIVRIYIVKYGIYIVKSVRRIGLNSTPCALRYADTITAVDRKFCFDEISRNFRDLGEIK